MMTAQRRAWEPLPGWYLDPAGGRQLRFWDGSQWTPQVRPARNERRTTLLVIGGLVAAFAVVAGFLFLLGVVEERRVRPGLEETLAAVLLPAEIRLVSEGYSGWMCLDVCPTLTRRYSSPLSREETHRVFAAALERLGYQCFRVCGQVDEEGFALQSFWEQPGKRSSQLHVDVRFTTDLDAYEPDPYPKDASSPVHADLSVH
jgi:Protein of unknown function (DUF2510)